jgi:hypothetical protein
MVRKIKECAQIVAGLAVVCASAISSAQAQPPVVYVEGLRQDSDICLC